MNICITGGLGYIGRHLVDNLCNAGHNVLVIDREDYKDQGITDFFQDKYTNFNFVHQDIHNIVVDDYFKDYKIEAVIHLASLTDARGHNSNYESGIYQIAMDVFNAACSAGVKTFVNASSASVYARLEGIATEYGFAKYMAEKNMLVKKNKYDYVPNLYNLRLFNPYGHSNVIPFSKHKTGLWFNAVRASREDTPISLRSKTLNYKGTCVRDWINIFDVVEIFTRFALKPADEYVEKPHWDVGTGQGICSYIFIKHFITIEDISLDINYIEADPSDVEYSVSSPENTNEFIKFRSAVGPKLYSNSYLNGVYVT